MTNETIPELPDWVKVLIDDARSEGYRSGRSDGEQHAWEKMEKIAARKGFAW